MNLISIRRLAGLVTVVGSLAGVAGAENPFLGRWALTIPGGGAGWLGIEEVDGGLRGSILWGGGGVVPVAAVKVADGKLVVTRVHSEKRKNAAGVEQEGKVTETITASLAGERLALVTERSRGDGETFGGAEFTGLRIKPLPPKPDLAKVKFGPPVSLFNGKDLGGWRLINPKSDNGWSVQGDHTNVDYRNLVLRPVVK